MPLGRFDQPVRWVLVKPNVTLARSDSFNVLRNAFAAATTFAVTPAAAGAGGEVARCAEPTATGTRSASHSNGA